jgi:hypothetical protein
MMWLGAGSASDIATLLDVSSHTTNTVVVWRCEVRYDIIRYLHVLASLRTRIIHLLHDAIIAHDERK